MSAGERYRFRTPTGIRITTTGLTPSDAEQVAAALEQIVHATPATYPG